jgi:hypothetical protein
MIKFYLHIPELPRWQEVFAEMVEKMDNSGLIDAVDEIHLCFNGVRSTGQLTLQPLVDANSKFKFVHVNGDANKWEWPTINYIKEQADAVDEVDWIGYAHLKGLTRPDDKTAIDWRHYLTHFTIEQWEENFKRLEEGYETVGVNWIERGWHHHSGNFWWASSNYIRRLGYLTDPSTVQWGTPSVYLENIPLDPGNVRFECEAWIGSGSPKAFELHASPIKVDGSYHYRFEYPESEYKKD